ncbi:hypothetical protein LTR53_019986, partial [Teratosphaeriaceae sp. CCFEE 6253]
EERGGVGAPQQDPRVHRHRRAGPRARVGLFLRPDQRAAARGPHGRHGRPEHERQIRNHLLLRPQRARQRARHPAHPGRRPCRPAVPADRGRRAAESRRQPHEQGAHARRPGRAP